MTHLRYVYSIVGCTLMYNLYGKISTNNFNLFLGEKSKMPLWGQISEFRLLLFGKELCLYSLFN